MSPQSLFLLYSPVTCCMIIKHSTIFIGRTDAEAPILWPPDVKSQLIGKTLMLGKIEDRRRGEGV